MSGMTVNLTFIEAEDGGLVAKSMLVGNDAPGIIMELSMGDDPSTLIVDMEAAGLDRPELAKLFKLLGDGFNQKDANGGE